MPIDSTGSVTVRPRTVLILMCMFGMFARGSTFQIPIEDHHSWRQADTAAIAKNFYEERFNILYPQIDWRGDRRAGYVETGLELYAFVVGALSFLTGFHYQIGRLLNIVIFLCSALLLWRFARRRYDLRTALLAVFLHSFGFPLLLFIERAFMNEAMLICLSLAALVLAQDYLRTGSRLSVVGLWISTAVIGAVKLPYLIIWGPIWGLFVEKLGWRRSFPLALVVMATANIAVAVAWYLHAHELGRTTGLSFGMLDKTFDADLILSTRFAVKIATRMFKDVLGPAGLIGGAAGALIAARRGRWFEPMAMLSFGAYLILVARGNFAHDYYQLALMPYAAAIAASGITALAARLSKGNTAKEHGLVVASLVLAASATFIRSVSFHSWYERRSAADAVVCDSLRAPIGDGRRLIVIGDNDPSWLFCTGRKGWLLAEYESDESHVRDAWVHGARLVLLARPQVDVRLQGFLLDHTTAIEGGLSRAFVLRP